MFITTVPPSAVVMVLMPLAVIAVPLALLANWLTVRLGPSTSLSLASTLPDSVVIVPSTALSASLVPTGASLTGVTLKVIVFGVGSVSMPPLAVPPSSFTAKLKFA